MSESQPIDPTELIGEIREKSARLVVSVPPESRRLIEEGGKKDLTYILPVTPAIERALALRTTVVLPEGSFQRKKEFHVTAIGFDGAELVRAVAAERGGDQAAVTGRINELLSETDFSFEIDPTSAKVVTNLEYDADAVRSKVGRKQHTSEKSVVMDVHMPGMVAFYDKLRAELGIDLGHPAAHVTLYVKDNGDATGLGIGIKDYEAQLRGDVYPKIEARPLPKEKILT